MPLTAVVVGEDRTRRPCKTLAVVVSAVNDEALVTHPVQDWRAALAVDMELAMPAYVENLAVRP
jgi:hypothetical protein